MERSDISFKFQPTLKRLSTIRIAINFWETPSAKIDVKKYFILIVNPLNLFPTDKKWVQVTKNRMEQLNSLNLPSKLSDELKNMIVFIGQKIFLYTLHVTKGHRYHVRYAQTLYWTGNGSIDEVKIFQNVWQKDPRFPDFVYSSSNFPGFIGQVIIGATLYSMASLYAQDKFLKASLHEVVTIIEAYTLSKIGKGTLKVHGAMAILLCFYVAGERSRALELYKSLKKGSKYSNAADNLFLFCATSGLEEPAKYYYKKVKENDRPNLLMKASKECLFKIDVKRSDACLCDKLLNMLVFLINEMSNEQKLDFLIENMMLMSLFKEFANSWPHQEFCIPMINFVSDHISEWGMKHLLYSTLNLLIEGSKLESYESKKTHQQILQNLLGKISKNYKIIIFVEKKKYWYDLFKVSDFTSMKIIINDEDLISHRREIINNGISINNMYIYIASEGKFELIEQFMIELHFTETEKDMFKDNYGCDILFDLVRTGRLDLADKLLNWRFPNSQSDRINMKRMINSDLLLSWFVSDKKYRLANDFLEWRFNTNEERELIKRRFRL